MGGFIGASKAGITTTIGRGGSDYSAAIAGAGLEAERIEIWTDVDGMMTTDPRMCPDARRIKVISFDEAAELAYFGAKVLHPATVLPAVQKNIPVYILNSRNPNVRRHADYGSRSAVPEFFQGDRGQKSESPSWTWPLRACSWPTVFSARFLRRFDRHRVAVDVVSTSEVSVSLTVDSNESIPALAADLAKLADVKYEGRKAIVCLVGENLRDTPGIAARVFGELADVKIRMISQGASEINLTFVIEEDVVPKWSEGLHKTFFSDSIRKYLRRAIGLFVNLLILGRGKTGSLVAEVARERGHTSRCCARRDNAERVKALSAAETASIDVVLISLHPRQ